MCCNCNPYMVLSQALATARLLWSVGRCYDSTLVRPDSAQSEDELDVSRSVSEFSIMQVGVCVLVYVFV